MNDLDVLIVGAAYRLVTTLPRLRFAILEATDAIGGTWSLFRFRAMRAGKAGVITDRVARFSARGVVLESGAELAADVVVTATGLELIACGGMSLRVDGQAVRVPETVVYKGVMLSGVLLDFFTMTYGAIDDGVLALGMSPGAA